MLTTQENDEKSLILDMLKSIRSTPKDLLKFDINEATFYYIPTEFKHRLQTNDIPYLIVSGTNNRDCVVSTWNRLKLGKETDKLLIVNIPPLIPLSLNRAKDLNSIFCEIALDWQVLIYRKSLTELNSFIGSRGIPVDSAAKVVEISHTCPQGTVYVLPSVDEIQQQLQLDVKNIDAETTFKYDILASMPVQFLNQNMQETSHIDLFIESSGYHEFTIPPVNPKNVKLQITYYSSERDADNYESTAVLRSQLSKLQAWSNSNEKSSPTGDFTRVSEFLDNIKQNGYVKPRNQNTEIFHPLPENENVDFIDLFWLYIQECSDQRQISDALSLICGEIEQKCFNPLIAKDNTSYFASVMRQCVELNRMETTSDTFDNISQTFDCWIENPTDIVIEIGLWALYREFYFQLVGQNLCTSTDLESYFDPLLEIDERIQNLVRLHRVLEVYTLIKKIQREVVKACLKHFVDCQDRDKLKIMISLPLYQSSTTRLVESFTKKIEPSEWIVDFKGTDKSGSVFVVKGEDLASVDENEVSMWNCEYQKTAKFTIQ